MVSLVVDVASVDEAVGKVVAAGGKVVAAGGKVVAPKATAPGVGWTTYFLDSEGVLFGVMQNDPAAR
jgi:predicted enzyme related to lactoylglutathione lyase